MLYCHGLVVILIPMRIGDRDSYGRYGIVDETTEEFLHHDCGSSFRYLGLHVWNAHQIRAADYRTYHGLRRKGLVADDLRPVMATNATRTMDQRPKFVENRDLRKTRSAFRSVERRFSPAGKEAIRKARSGPRPKSFHPGTTCEECEAQFCHTHMTGDGASVASHAQKSITADNSNGDRLPLRAARPRASHAPILHLAQRIGTHLDVPGCTTQC